MMVKMQVTSEQLCYDNVTQAVHQQNTQMFEKRIWANSLQGTVDDFVITELFHLDRPLYLLKIRIFDLSLSF